MKFSPSRLSIGCQVFKTFLVLQNVKYWGETHLTVTDRRKCINSLYKLLWSHSDGEFVKKLDKLRSSWPIPFQKYFESHLHADVKQSIQGKGDQFKVFGLHGVTSNASESINKLFRHLLDFKKKPLVETMGISQFILTSTCDEIRRSVDREGELSVKVEKEIDLRKILPPKMWDAISLNCIQQIFEHGKYSAPVDCGYKPKLYYLKSRDGLGEFFYKCYRVAIIGADIFVRGIRGKMFNVSFEALQVERATYSSFCIR